MRKISLLLLTILTAIGQSVQCADDFEKGFDFTGVTTINGTMLNYLVDNATVRTNRGIIIATNNPPNVTANPRFKYYIWLDTNYDPPVPKIWSPSFGSWKYWSFQPDSIDTFCIKDYAITTSKLATNAVNNVNINDGAISSSKIIDNQIVTSKIADGAVTRDKIFNGAIDENKITNGAITSLKISDGAITRDKILDGAIDGNKIMNGAITSLKISDNAIQSNHIGIAQVNNFHIRTNSIFGSHIAAAQVNDTHLADWSVSTRTLQDGAVNNSKIQQNTITIDRLAPSLRQKFTIAAFARLVGNGADAPSIANSYNINSVNRINAGVYEVNFASPLSDTNYIVQLTASTAPPAGSLFLPFL
ncbi:MAG: hypothetical protein ACPLX7_10515, partial [Candidatus Kapaibacteriota bacterium]